MSDKANSNQDPSNGRFVPGNKAGKGRVSKLEVRYLEIVAEEVTPQVWRDIIKRAVGDALKGNKDARSWLSGYVARHLPQQFDLGVDPVLLLRLIQLMQANGLDPAEGFEAMIQKLASQDAGYVDAE